MALTDEAARRLAREVLSPRPQPVTIIQPNRSARQSAVTSAARVVHVFLTAWLVMLVLPAVTGWHFGYWRAVASLCLLWLLWKPSPISDWSQSFSDWTKSK